MQTVSGFIGVEVFRPLDTSWTVWQRLKDIPDQVGRLVLGLACVSLLLGVAFCLEGSVLLSVNRERMRFQVQTHT
jgi:hypothetical protein